MNQPEQSPERRGRHVRTTPTLEVLGLTTDSPTLIDLWEEGLTRWGDAFAAYITLRSQELHTPDVLTNFEHLYVATFDDVEAMVGNQLDGLGWNGPLEKLRREQKIAEELLDWNYEGFVRQLEFIYEIVESGGRIHVFGK